MDKGRSASPPQKKLLCYYPLILDLLGKQVVVVGGGRIDGREFFISLSGPRYWTCSDPAELRWPKRGLARSLALKGCRFKA